MNRVIIFILFALLFGCNGQMALNSEAEPKNSVDLDRLLEEGESDEDSDVTLHTTISSTVTTNQDDDDTDAEAPPWTQKLNSEINNQVNVGSGKSGKQKVRVSIQDDLVTKGEEETKKVEKVSVPEKELEVSEVIQDVNLNVDILFVIDTSYSMHNILRSIPQKMSGFIEAIKPLHWRIGFIDAVVQRGDKQLSHMELDGALVVERRYITKTTKLNESIFIDTLTRNKNEKSCSFPPHCGTRRERPLRSLTQYLVSPAQSDSGARFLRDSADLVVIILTDNRENRYKGHPMSAAQVQDVFDERFGEDKNLTVYTLTVLNQECRNQMQLDHFFAESNYAPEMTLLAHETSGSNLSLCLPNYSELAHTIVKNQLGD